MNSQYKKELILNLRSFYSTFQKEILDLIPNNNNFGLSSLLYKILHEINMDGTTVPSVLSKRLAVSIPNISRGIRKLAELGYITKTKDKIDKRITHLCLSQKGIDLIDTSLKTTDAIVFKKLDRLDLGEIKKLSDSFAEIRDLIIKMV